jgi:hypothetical protein
VNETKVIIETDDGRQTLTDVADVAEVMDGRLQVADLDGNREMISGSIFGAFGRWRMWHENRVGEVEKFTSDTPLTMPGDFTRFYYENDRLECLLKQERGGRIKRLRRADL